MMKYNVSAQTKYSFEYKTSDDYFTPSVEEAKELLEKLINKKASFSYSDWFGGTSDVKVWVEKVEFVRYRFIVTVKSNQRIPDRFFPSLLEIARQFNLAAPLGYSIESR